MNPQLFSVSEVAERYRRVAGRFSRRAAEVPDEAWEHPGPRVVVPDDADEQTRLIAFTGRQP